MTSFVKWRAERCNKEKEIWRKEHNHCHFSNSMAALSLADKPLVQSSLSSTAVILELFSSRGHGHQQAGVIVCVRFWVTPCYDCLWADTDEVQIQAPVKACLRRTSCLEEVICQKTKTKLPWKCTMNCSVVIIIAQTQ